MMLAGLMSRWITPREWANSRAERTWSTYRMPSRRSTVPWRRHSSRLALHQFHDHDHLVFHPEGRSQVGDVRVFQAGVNADFPQEPVGQAGVCGGIREHDLHRLDALGEQVADTENLPHIAPAEESNDFVVADDPATAWPPLRIARPLGSACLGLILVAK